ncbi:MAG: hypothetical protein ABI165_07870 [Bryobacteraceae bacterium]
MAVYYREVFAMALLARAISRPQQALIVIVTSDSVAPWKESRGPRPCAGQVTPRNFASVRRLNRIIRAASKWLSIHSTKTFYH